MENQLGKRHRRARNYSSIALFSPVYGHPSSGVLMAVLTFILLASLVNRDMTSTFAEFLARLTWTITVLFFALTATVTFVTTFHAIGNTLRSVKLRIGGLALFMAAGAVTWTGPRQADFYFFQGMAVTEDLKMKADNHEDCSHAPSMRTWPLSLIDAGLS